jgi:hypothetical protein
MLGFHRMLKPLKQWICDDCRHVIRSAKEGWVEWLIDSDNRKHKGFRIVHYHAYSPRSPQDVCHRYTDTHDEELIRNDVDYTYLTNFVDRGPMPMLLMFLDPGPYVEQQFSEPGVVDIREWSEFARRLTIPYYEQARIYMPQAARDGFFKGYYEPEIYYPANLKKVVQLYANRM